MSSEISYQNRDLDNLNPFTPRANTTDLEVKNTPKSDPKVRLLVILGIIVVILSVLSLAVNILRRRQSTVGSDTVPTITSAPLPTDIPDSVSLPADLKTNFDNLNKSTQTSINFDPPQIDTTIGL